MDITEDQTPEPKRELRVYEYKFASNDRDAERAVTIRVGVVGELNSWHEPIRTPKAADLPADIHETLVKWLAGE